MIVPIVTALPIISGYDVSELVAIVAVPGAIMNVEYYISVITIPKKFPNSYNEIFSKLSFPLLVMLIALACIISLRLSWSAFTSLNKTTINGMAVFYGIGTIYYFYLKSSWDKKGKSFAKNG